MAVNFKNSETRLNLMRAFAGESQARNRYTFAAAFAKTKKLPVVEEVFLFTADQEKEHAEVFYNFLKEFAGETIEVDGGYPVDISESVAELLRMAQHNEYEEHNPIYATFGQTAENEGFPAIANAFRLIADIEKYHGDRFGKFADLIESGKLFVSDVSTGWMCLNCGNIYEGEEAPEICPVCKHERGYYIRLSMAPFQE